MSWKIISRKEWEPWYHLFCCWLTLYGMSVCIMIITQNSKMPKMSPIMNTVCNQMGAEERYLTFYRDICYFPRRSWADRREIQKDREWRRNTNAEPPETSAPFAPNPLAPIPDFSPPALHQQSCSGATTHLSCMASRNFTTNQILVKYASGRWNLNNHLAGGQKFSFSPWWWDSTRPLVPFLLPCFQSVIKLLLHL